MPASLASFPATLTATVDDRVVTLTLAVSNPSKAPARIAFTTSQRAAFTISDARTGALHWSSAEGMSFAQTLGQETIPARGSLEYSATWRAPGPGDYVADGALASASHSARAMTTVTVR